MRRMSLFPSIALLALALGCGSAQPNGTKSASHLEDGYVDDSYAASLYDDGSDVYGFASDGSLAVDGGTVSADGGFVGVLPTCSNRPSGRTQIDAVVRVDKYDGLQRGRNGTHEILEAMIVQTLGVADSSVVDTQAIKAAVNVASTQDPSGLPNEIPLNVGDILEIAGEYIPASQANATTVDGAAAVLHFSHKPCGYLNINGVTYQ